ncbi:hypothetical protein [Limnoglobus roseus]|uniref:PEP-CTERM sorting domain-containing protein n=1 Tax=Limnoglobus roseus TaxID=2598579 RepID=A0A5C1A7G5_9BACT|nr:hypothetical protein [Limnoglobus roseus]QEL14147.1 hypothetical protein PX52LOC_01017 [Limnoglobus roseus]
MKWLIAVTLAFSLTLTGQAAFIVNGNFETGSLSPWSSVNTTISSNGNLPGSTFNAAFLVGNSTLTQILSLPAPGAYNLSFQLAFAGSDPSDVVNVTLGGVSAFHLTSSPSPGNYVSYTTTVNATITNPALQFSTTSNTHLYRLDNVDVTAASAAVVTPEPASLTSLGIGLAVLSCNRLLRRRKSHAEV